VNTGFGKLASLKIAAADTATLQRNLILSHCCGVGAPMPRAVTRLMMALKLLSLGRGASGVRWEIIEMIEAMLATGVTPVIPAQGSVGASGDLAPLAHMTAVMIGAGEARWTGHPSGGRSAGAGGPSPVTLGPKEGLALINGTQFSTAYALAGLFDGWRAAQAALVVSACRPTPSWAPPRPCTRRSTRCAAMPARSRPPVPCAPCSTAPRSAKATAIGDTRVQDPYCIRCQPQVTGAAMDVLRMAAATLEIEANAATDNPLVLSDGQIVSGGNFHAEPVGFAADMIALAIAKSAPSRSAAWR
jgi:histidine ammonia-lyase